MAKTNIIVLTISRTVNNIIVDLIYSKSALIKGNSVPMNECVCAIHQLTLLYSVRMRALWPASGRAAVALDTQRAECPAPAPTLLPPPSRPPPPYSLLPY